MIQDIDPYRLNNAYSPQDPRPGDRVLSFGEGGKMLVSLQNGALRFAGVDDIPADNAIYLFSVNDVRYFLAREPVKTDLPGFEYRAVRDLRDIGRGKEIFVAFTAYHLWKWYDDNRRCGRCGGPNGCHPAERALQCGCCGHVSG